MIKKKEPEQPLYRVFFKGTNRTPYLPAGKGLLKAEAERISDMLTAETEIKCVYQPEPEEE
jgi:hypothetical protein